MVEDEFLKAIRNDIRFMKFSIQKINEFMELFIAIGEIDTPPAEYFRSEIGQAMNNTMEEFINFEWKA